MDPDILTYYDRRPETDRLASGPGVIERVRTQHILRRVLPPPPARVLDVGGATGVYATWLAGLGYSVRLVDPVPRHVEAARESGVDAVPGDARALVEPDASYDAVLVMGPLYHLTAPEERLAALREAARVVRPGGVVAAAAISRFASLHSAFLEGAYTDPEFLDIVAADLATGVHRNPNERPRYFTTAYFHAPDELADELRAAGLDGVRVIAVEGVAGWVPGAEAAFTDERVLALVARVEEEPALVGASAHLLAVATRPAN
ncbi:methyltransferase domain-containing protein [Micromonospora sp. CPCC 205371]|nr:methyltransferase domain-containing protein [Micromonospora sp. CPCC 205371]